MRNSCGKALRWGGTEAACTLSQASVNFGQVGRRLDRVTRDYEIHLRTFVDLLPTQTPMDLNFLLFRLDNRAFLSLTPQAGAA